MGRLFADSTGSFSEPSKSGYKVVDAGTGQWANPDQRRLALDATPGWSAPELVPDPPGPLTPTDRRVRWAIYEDGTLVINGENEPNYGGHGNVQVSCDTAVWQSRFGEWGQYGLLDLDGNNYNAMQYPGPWSCDIGGSYIMPSYSEKITQVEFAKPTAPTKMTAWFASAPNIVRIDATNLDLSQCKSMDHTFAAQSSQYAHHRNILPDIQDWDVSSVESLRGTFMGPYVNDANHPGTVLDLSNWRPAPGCNASNMFQNSSNLCLIFSRDWQCGESNAMFAGCTSLQNAFTEATYDPDRDDESMANVWNGGYFSEGVFPWSRKHRSYGRDEVEEALTLGEAPAVQSGPVEFPLVNLMMCLNRHLVVNEQLILAMRDSITEPDQVSSLLDMVEPLEATVGDIAGNPDGARAALETLLSQSEPVLSRAGLAVDLTDVERTEYLTYVEFTLNGAPVRTSLRLG